MRLRSFLQIGLEILAMVSKAQCSECEDILESKHRHDFVTCKCGKSFLDGGDEYFRGGGYILPILDALDEDMFEDQGYLDDDFDDYNLGVQAGIMEERERILKIIADYRNKPTFGYSNLISLIRND
jgi:hypothetical protein